MGIEPIRVAGRCESSVNSIHKYLGGSAQNSTEPLWSFSPPLYALLRPIKIGTTMQQDLHLFPWNCLPYATVIPYIIYSWSVGREFNHNLFQASPWT